MNDLDSQSENWDTEEGESRQRGQDRRRLGHMVHPWEHPHQSPWESNKQQLRNVGVRAFGQERYALRQWWPRDPCQL